MRTENGTLGGLAVGKWCRQEAAAMMTLGTQFSRPTQKCTFFFSVTELVLLEFFFWKHWSKVGLGNIVLMMKRE